MIEQLHNCELPGPGNFRNMKSCPTGVIDFPRMIADYRRMPNRIKKYRHRAGMTQQALADALGTGKSTVVKLERGDRPLSQPWMERIAPILDCQPADLLDNDVPVVGKIGAGGSVAFEDIGGDDRTGRPPETGGTLVGLEVEGDSMLPKFDPGDIVFISRDYDGVNASDIGSYCAVRLRSGETYLKILSRGSAVGLFTLRSLNAADMENVEVEWATPVRAITPRAARRFN